MRAEWVLVLLAAVALVGAVACNDARNCEQDSDCFSDEVCLDEICVQGTRADDAGGNNGNNGNNGGDDAGVSDDQLVQIEAGAEISCAMYGDGRVFCWGLNDEGLLNVDSGMEELPFPTQVNGLPAAKELRLGWTYACIVSVDDEAWCWGENWGAQSGVDNTTIIAPTRIPVDKVSMLRTGFRGGCVLSEDRLTVICWGDAPDPKSFENPVVDFDVGEEHACAVIEGGDVRCWGSDRYDRTGLDDPIRGISDVEQISAGLQHTCALKNDGTVWCWGDNGERQLGRPLDDPDQSGLPVQADGVTGVVEVYSEAIHTCARFEDGSIECWGGFAGWDIYDYRDSEYREPTLVFPFTSDVVDFDTGRTHNCALKSDGKAYCWGNNGDAQLGNEDADLREEDAVEVMF